MRVISTRVHGMLDYGVGILLLVVPYLLGFADGTAAQYVPQALGLAIIGMSLITNYELSLVRIMPMRLHLAIDIIAGILLASSPWLFGFADRVALPHLVVGIVVVVVALLTETASPVALSGARAGGR